MTDKTTMRALNLAAKTADAHSADAFGPVRWVEASQMLVDLGLTDEQIKGVLRSKWTRWCRDHFSEPHYYVAELYRTVATARPTEINALICEASQ